MNGACAACLPDGRLHLQHGPIDVLVECWGERDEVHAAYRQAWSRFRSILDELVGELPLLRTPVGSAFPELRGPVARRMAAAVWPHRSVFITPMAAVAGAVADELLEALLAGRSLHKAYVNDGGDIALYLAADQEIRVGVVDDPAQPRLAADARICGDRPSRGVATSGWRGRSQSLGIADAVTVLARSAAQADAAATLVANAVNVAHPAIRRQPARELKEDSDLLDLPVTVAVDELPPSAVEEALARGIAAAGDMRATGLIDAAYLALQGRIAAC